MDEGHLDGRAGHPQPPEGVRGGETVDGAQAAAEDVEPRDAGDSLTAGTRAGLDSRGSMRGRVLRGAGWSASSRLLTQGLQFLVGLVLARLLLPEQFGLLASVYVFSGFAVMFFELGLGAALVQREDPSERDLATVFWLNALGGVVFAALFAAAGPLVADFYGEPELRRITPLVALAFTLSVGVVHNALLTRRLQFETIARIEVVSAVLGHATTLVTAFAGAGAYALAYGPLVTSAAASALSWSAVRWRPRHFVSWTSVRDLWRFSGGLLGFNVVNYWGRNADNLLVGRFLGASPLGLYNRAYNLMLLPIYQVTGALGRVMFPALSAIQHDHARVRGAYLRSLRVINAATLPLLVGLAAVAPGAVPLLWGPTWTATVPVLQVLCLAGLPQCVGTSVGWLYQSQGRTGTMFVVSTVSSALGVLAIVAGLRWGVTGVAVAVLARYWLELPVSLHLAGRSVGLRARTVLAGAAPTLVASLGMGAVVWFLPSLLGTSREGLGVLALQVGAGVLVYLALLLVLARAVVVETLDVVRRRRAGP